MESLHIYSKYAIKIMNWNISYYNKKVEHDVLNLPDLLLARYIHYTEIMQEFGPNIGYPHTKALGDGLFELRSKGKEGIARVFYCTKINNEILMLHSIIKKQQKTPINAIRLANKRLNEVCKYAKKNT